MFATIMSMLGLPAARTIPFLISVLFLALKYSLGFTKSSNDMGHAIAPREPHLAVSKHMHMLYPIGCHIDTQCFTCSAHASIMSYDLLLPFISAAFFFFPSSFLLFFFPSIALRSTHQRINSQYGRQRIHQDNR